MSKATQANEEVHATKRETDGSVEAPGVLEPWLRTVEQLAKSMRFGVLQLTIHEGRVVQVEKSEKIRFDVSGRNRVGIASEKRDQ